ncbi:MAG TPA: MmgE/PrpD family protein [Nocardioidaceae bacterium]|nr:MmgE/PrpD family protein [Nocardioidaceae bacterium]
MADPANDPSPSPLTRALADFARESTYASLPEDVRDFVKLCILDQVGAQAYGSTLPVSGLVRDYVRGGSTGACTIVGSTATVSAEGAALANAVAGHGFELDDVHLPSLNHPGVAVVPAALAVGELVGATGEDLVAAVALGYEVMCRVGRGLAPSYVSDRGFHPQGIVGPLGAAVAAAVLLELEPPEIEHAMSLGVSHSGGTLQYLESHSESPQLHAGLGAMGGVRSALLAEAGFRGPRQIIEGRYGLARAYADTVDLGLMTDALGSEYSLLYNTFKVRPYHAFVHAAVDAVVEALATRPDVSPEDIERIVLGASSRMNRFVGGTTLGDSVELPVAHAVVQGGAATELVSRVFVRHDEECEREFNSGGQRGAKVKVKSEIVLRDGSVLRAECYAKGSYENPLTAAEMRDKAEGLLERGALGEQASTVSEMVLDCERLASVKDLTRLLSGNSSAAADA